MTVKIKHIITIVSLLFLGLALILAEKKLAKDLI